MGIKILKRKFVPSTSSSEEYDPVSGACSIEFFMASKDQFRVAPANEIPVPWPYDSLPSTEEADQIVESIRNSYERVLKECGIELDTARMQMLCRQGYSNSRNTLILNTKGENPQPWMAAATEIKEILDEYLRTKNTDLKIGVEIRNEARMYQDTSSIIEPSSAAHQACLEIQDLIYNEIRKICKNYWTTISYHMRGPRWQEQNRKPTVIVTAAPGTRHFWATIEEQIQQAIKISSSVDVQIHVEVLAGAPSLLIVDESKRAAPLLIRNLPAIPHNGSSIGPRGSTSDAGSVGTWVYFQPKGSATKQRCFLTCYHVVAPGDPRNRTTNDDNGIGLDKKPVIDSIRVDYPAPFDALHTKTRLRSQIANGDDPEGKKARTIAMIDNLVATGGIGTVINASGIRISKQIRRMDWALVRIAGSNIPQNRPPPANFSPGQLFNGDLEYEVGPNEAVSKIGSLNETIEGSWAAKIGRSTGITVGQVSSIKCKVRWADGEYENVTEETVISSLVGGSMFAKPGDSGSMVFNIKKEWVGMIWGVLSFNELAYMTPAKDIIADIEAKTEGTISLT